MTSCMASISYLGFRDRVVVPTKAASIPRFSMLVCGMFCSICIAAIYAFSLITDKLTNDYHFTQNDITTISTVGIVVGYFTFPFGIIYDYIGPKPIFIFGIIFNALGALLFALTFDERIGHSVAGLAIINAIMNLGSAMFDMGTVLTTLSWFPLDRGLVIACMKTMTGLGSSFVATLYNTYFPGNNVTYMYFLFAMSIAIGCVAFVLFYLPPYHLTGFRRRYYDEEEQQLASRYESVYMRQKAPIKRFVIAFVLVISLLIVICTCSVVFVFSSPTVAQRQPSAIIAICIYGLLLTVLTPWKWLDEQPGSYDSGNLEATHHLLDSATKHEFYHGKTQEQKGDDASSGSRAAPRAATSTGVAVSREGAGAGDARHGAANVLDGREHGASKATTAALNDELDANGGNSTPERDVADKSRGALDANDALTRPRTRKELQMELHKLLEEEKISPQFPTGFFYNIRRPTLLCMWITGFCVSGVVIVVMMNSTQIYYAVAESADDKQRPALYVALTSIGSALGRLIMAFIEVYTQSQPADKRIPLTTFYCVPPVLCILSCILFLFIPAPGLLAPMLLAGLGNGFYAAAEVLTVRTIFSVDVAKHYNSLFFFEMLAVIFMNRLMFGELMTRNSTRDENDAPQCLDRTKCTRISFIILVCLSAFGLATSIYMNLTYVRFARGEYAKRRAKRLEVERLLDEESAAQNNLIPLEPID